MLKAMKKKAINQQQIAFTTVYSSFVYSLSCTTSDNDQTDLTHFNLVKNKLNTLVDPPTNLLRFLCVCFSAC